MCTKNGQRNFYMRFFAKTKWKNLEIPWKRQIRICENMIKIYFTNISWVLYYFLSTFYFMMIPSLNEKLNEDKKTLRSSGYKRHKNVIKKKRKQKLHDRFVKGRTCKRMRSIAMITKIFETVKKDLKNCITQTS